MKVFNLKAVALALSLTVFGSVSANANTSALSFDVSGNAQFGNQFFVINNAFDDLFTFTIGAGDTGLFSASASSNYITVFDNLLYGIDITGFNVLTNVGTEVSYTQGILNTPIALNDNTWSLTAANLAAGNYALHVTGRAIPSGLAGAAVSYGGTANLSVSPVPEADTSAMMLMGLGLMGFIARRRKLDQA